MYHAHMLEAVLDVRDACVDSKSELSVECASTAKRMAVFLQSLLHPDGDIPLLGDSAFGECPDAAHLIARAGQGTESQGTASQFKEGEASRVGNYWIARDANSFLLFDGGNAGPDHLPAHAHADLLTLEASVDGKRLFVDSGVFNYQDDDMRRYCRSTAAHNVLQIDDLDQFDLWSRFRMGYRGWTYDFKSGQRDGYQWAEAWHDAYRRIGVPRVSRRIMYRSGGPWTITDTAVGQGRHKLTSRLHIHPDWAVVQTSYDELALQHGATKLILRALGHGTLTIASGWYCQEFGRRIESPVAEWTVETDLPATCGWRLE
jgi:uncharacterized heparinase superfamily protein